MKRRRDPQVKVDVSNADRLESELNNLFDLYLHNVNSDKFQSELSKLLRRCSRNLQLITENTISSLKFLARLHGLPSEILTHLLKVFEDGSTPGKFQFQVSTAHTIKYCVQKNPSFATAAQIVPILEKYHHQYEEKEKNFLQKELLKELALIVSFLRPGDEQENDIISMGKILKQCWQYLGPEDKVGVKSRLESQGSWSAFQSAPGTTGFFNDEAGSGPTGYENMESFYKSRRISNQPMAFVTKEQQLDAMTSEESEKSETISFNIQCQPSFLSVESRNNFLEAEAQQETELRPPSHESSTVLDTWHKFRWTTTNIDLLQQKVNRAPTTVTRDELKYLEDSFYTSIIFCTKEEPVIDRKISEMFKTLSGTMILECSTLRSMLSKSRDMLLHPKREPLYSLQDKEIILQNTVAVIAKKCSCISREEFAPLAEILTEIDQYLRNPQNHEWRFRQNVNAIRQDIWKIFQLKARFDEGETIERTTEALKLLSESTAEHGALDFIFAQVQYGWISVITWADALVPAMLKVLMDRSRDSENDSSYSTDEITQALNILQFYFSEEQANLKLNDTQLVSLFDALLRWQQFERIPDFVTQCAHKLLNRLINHISLTELWKALWSCVEHMISSGPDNCSLKQKREVFVAMDNLLVASRRLNSVYNFDYGLAPDHTNRVHFIAGMLQTRAVICSDGDVLEDPPEGFDPSLSVGEIHGKSCWTMSSVVAKILLGIQSKHSVSPAVVDAICEALTDDCYTLTRIYCSEYLYQIVSVRQKPLNLVQLQNLQNYLQDPVTDVRIYSRLAYVGSLVAYPAGEIPTHHLYNLAEIYAFNPLRLDGKDFTEQINPHILKIFKKFSTSPAVRFTTEIYETLAFALNKMLQDSAPEAVNLVAILETVEDSLKNLPPDETFPPVVTKMATDAFLQMDSKSQKCFRLLRKIQDRGNWLPDEVLRQCSELLHNNSSSLAQECVSIANCHQDLPESMFVRFFLDLMGRRLSSEISNPLDALICLHHYLEKGQLLSVSNFQALKHYCLPQATLQEKTIECLVSASSNGQHLPVAITDAVFTTSEENTTTDERLAKQLDLALVLVRSNQTLPSPFLQLVIDKFYNLEIPSFVGSEGRQILDLLTTMIHLNYSLESDKFSRIAESLGCLAVAMLKTKDTKGLMPSNIILPVISCLIERRAVPQPTLIRWKEALIEAALGCQNEVLSDLPTLAKILHRPRRNSVEEPPKPTFRRWIKNSRRFEINYCPLDKLQLLDAILDPLLKLPHDCLTDKDFKDLILKVLLPSSASPTARALISKYGKEHQCVGNLWDALNLLTNPEDLDETKFLSGIITYLHCEIELKLDKVAVKRLENILKNLTEASERIADCLGTMVLMSPKDRQYLSPLADAVFFAKIGSTSTKVIENCDYIVSCLDNLQIPCNFSVTQRSEQTFRQNGEFSGDWNDSGHEVNKADLTKALEQQVLEDDVTWNTILTYIQHTKSHPSTGSMDTVSKLALKFPQLGQNRFNSTQIRTFIEFTTNLPVTLGNPTMELIQLWKTYLTFEEIPAVRKLCFSALASARKTAQTPDLCALIEELWPEICTNKIKAVYQEIFQDLAENILRKQMPSFTEQLAATLYSLDNWNLAPLREIPIPQWIDHLLISDLIEKYSKTETERITLFLAIKRYLDTGGNLQLLANFVPDKAAEASENFSLSVLDLIELLTIQISQADFNQESVKNIQLKSIIIPVLEKKIADKFTASPPRDFTVMLAEWLLDATKNNYRIADKLLDQTKKIEDGGIFLDILNILKNDESPPQQLCHRLNQSKPVETAMELKISVLSHALLALLPDVQASAHCASIERNLTRLFQSNYEAGPLQRLLSLMIKSPQPKEVIYLQVDHILHQLCQYEIDYQSFAAHLDQFIAQGSTKMSESLNSFVQSELHGLSTQERAKSWSELVAELYQLNPTLEMHPNGVNLLTEFTEASRTANYGHWTSEKFSEWADKMRRYRHRVLQNSSTTVGVIARALKFLRDWNLTSVQIASILLALNKTEDKIQLQQVSTGSGKSAIIAVVAVARALEGHKVDIYTSSPVLAQRDAKEWSSFYQIFGLTCSHNVERGSGYVKGLKKCYESDIVYGDMAQFQFDTLREEYSGLGTRGSREFGYALVDEVDSMCIDDSSKLARLSSTLPGMDLLHIVYHFIWNHLQGLHSQLSYVDGKLFFKQESDQQELLEPIEDIESFMKTRLKDYIRSNICNPEGHLNLPKHIRKYAETQVSNWAESAITALTFHENEHYVIDDGQIKPVDFTTTGVVQSSTNWNNGLHPFLQIKHSLRVTPETITTNFMSNKAVLSKYENKIVGFTGTLGSEESKALLQNAYNAESIVIPERYFKRFKRLQDVVVGSDEEWSQIIVYNSVHEAMKKRAVLVICQTIKDAEFLARELQRYKVAKFVECNIKLYVRNDRSQESHVERVHPTDIIVATNLGTRGMDIKAGDVEPYGGLHVILTYLPESMRVEEQAFGRTSRQGNRGTGQLIIAGIFDQHVGGIRNKNESKRLDSFVTHDLPIIQLKDELFGKFCKSFSKIREQLKNKSVVSRWGRKIMKFFNWEQLSPFDYSVLGAIEEQWAMLLKNVDDDAKKYLRNFAPEDIDNYSEIMHQRYQELQQHIESNYRNLDLLFSKTENCFYWIHIGNELYKRRRLVENSAKKSIKYFEKATAPDNCAAPAFLGMAAAVLLSSDQTCTDRETALKYLQSAMNHTQSEIRLCQHSLQLLPSQADGHNTELQKQLERRLEVLGKYSQNIENIYNNVNRSVRRLICTATNALSSKSVTISHESCDLPVLDGCTYRLAFHNLSCRTDMNTIDQAIDTVKTAFSQTYRFFTQNFSVTLRIPSSENVSLKFTELIAAAPSARLSVIIEELISRESFDLALQTTQAVSMDIKLSGNGASVQAILDTPGLQQKHVLIFYTEDTEGQSNERTKAFVVGTDTGHVEPILSCNQNSAVSISFAAATEDFVTFTTLLVEYDVSATAEIRNIDPGNFKCEDWTALCNHFSDVSIALNTKSQKEAEELVQTLRQQKADFALEFENLTFDQAKYLSQNASRDFERVEQTLDLLSKKLPDPDLLPLILRGIELLPEFSEKNFVPWKTMAVVGIMGSAQVALGIALATTEVGARTGMLLADEGITDLIFTVTAVMNREFTWSDYEIQKASRVRKSVKSLGLAGLMNGAKGLKALWQGGVAIMSWQQAALSVATRIAYREMDVALVSFSRFSFDSVKDYVEKTITEKVRQYIVENEEFKDDLILFLASQSFRRAGSGLPNKLANWLKELPQSCAEYALKVQATCNMLCDIVLTMYKSEDMKTAITYSKIISTVMIAMAGLKEIYELVEKVIDHLQACIRQENRLSASPKAILSIRHSTTQVERVFQVMDIGEDFGMNLRAETDEDFQLYDTATQIFSEFQRIKEGLYRDGSNEIGTFVKHVVDLIVKDIIKTANKNLFSQPMVRKLTQKLQRRFCPKMPTFRNSQHANSGTSNQGANGNVNPDDWFRTEPRPQNLSIVSQGGQTASKLRPTAILVAQTEEANVTELEVNKTSQLDAAVEDMEEAIKFVKASRPRKAMEFLRSSSIKPTFRGSGGERETA